MLHRTRTSITLVAIGLAAAASLSACTTQPAEPAATKTVTTTSSPSTTASASSSSTPGASGSPSTGGSGGSAAAPSGTGDTASNTCSTDQLSGSIGPGGGGAAGSVEVSIALENTGSSACTLQGWPGVSFVGDGNGTQIGAAAQLDRNVPHATVTVQPGGRVLAPLKIVQAANIPTADCSPLQADGFRVYPPGSKTSVFIATKDYTACRASGEQLLSVQAFTQG